MFYVLLIQVNEAKSMQSTIYKKLRISSVQTKQAENIPSNNDVLYCDELSSFFDELLIAQNHRIRISKKKIYIYIDTFMA
jgi:hypothetical protein